MDVMKLSFRLIALIVAIGFVFFDYSISLGIILATVALELIKLSRVKMEAGIMNADKLSTKFVFAHFFIVLIIMAITLLVSFLLPEIFNPFAVALVFIADRIYGYIIKLVNPEVEV